MYTETCALIVTGLDELTEPLRERVSELDAVWDSARDNVPTPSARPVAAALPWVACLQPAIDYISRGNAAFNTTAPYLAFMW